MTRDSLNPNIALYGAPGAGKSTAAELLVGRYGYHRVSFAGFHKGGIRDIAIRIWGAEAAQDRDKLDALSTLRAYDPDVWQRPALELIDRLLPEANIVIDDLRTPREWPALVGRGFVTVRLWAAADKRIDRLRNTGKFTTVEELEAPIQTALDDRILWPPDYMVYNEDDLTELGHQMVQIINRERRKRA